ncbi:MAG: transposase [Chthoniobacterales bacterium]
MTSQMTVKRAVQPAAHFPGSAGAAPAISGASPETSGDISYAKRRLPHFERPWSKYAVVFSTHERHTLAPPERDIVLQSVLYASDQDQYELYVACVMPDHVHLLFEPRPRDVDSVGQTRFWSLAKILHGIKSTSSHRINKLRRVSGTVLEGESFDRLIRSERDLQEKFRYICRNPWEAGIVTPAEDYRWLWTPGLCSARAPNTAGEAPALPGKGNAANAHGTGN